MVDPSGAPSPVKDAIDSNSGRFEFLKQTLTLGSAGIGGIAALFTAPARIPSDPVSKASILVGGVARGFVIYYSVMGLSVFANLLTATTNEAAGKPSPQPVSFYVNGLRDHARGVVIGLFVAFYALSFFAFYRLYFLLTGATAEAAIETASAFVSKETKQPPETLNLTRLETDNDAFSVTYIVTATNSEATVRISKKDGSVVRLIQDKKSVPSGAKQP
jgi:hypothetical protein